MILAFRHLELFLLAVAAASMTLVGTGCGERSNAQTASPVASISGGEKTFSSQITGYNHTDKSISWFSVNGVWGGSLWRNSNGGDICCLQLPSPWPVDLKVKVDWEDDQGQQHSLEIPVPQYNPKSTGVFNVHFLRSGEIKVFEVNAFLGHPDYPLRGAEANLKLGVPNVQLPRAMPASN